MYKTFDDKIINECSLDLRIEVRLILSDPLTTTQTRSGATTRGSPIGLQNLNIGPKTINR